MNSRESRCGPSEGEGYEALVANGVIKPPPETAAQANDWESFVHLDVDPTVDPLAVLQQLRADSVE